MVTFEQSLEQVVRVLAAEDYQLTVIPLGPSLLQLAVAAGPSACSSQVWLQPPFTPSTGSFVPSGRR
jgi:hypothetical protein